MSQARRKPAAGKKSVARPAPAAKPAPKSKAVPALTAAAADDDEYLTETESIASTSEGRQLENGRVYPALRDGQYWAPTDDKQFEAMEAAHYLYLAFDRDGDENPFCQSPIGKGAQHILDIGTGDGRWAIAIAEKFRDAIVRGVDLCPPPTAWIPPNCFLEVDDVLQEWTWREEFDVIHMRHLFGSFNEKEWASLYKQCYENLKPGGWIEQVEPDLYLRSDDSTLAADNVLVKFGPTLYRCAARTGRGLDTARTMRAALEKAGFTDVHEHVYKCPIGSWPKGEQLKAAGQVNQAQWLFAVEGWAMRLLTKHAEPKPWTAGQVRTYVGRLQEALRLAKGNKVHAYHFA
ncbi:hypothetical protein FQN52_000172 [Onygenales sp. PD_12]|nr:hypothetical protein FQN52_000172 [Onygenales sp. PD_12]